MNVTDIIINTMKDLGYNVQMKLLNSANYGVPQKEKESYLLELEMILTKNFNILLKHITKMALMES